ncbi:hypothetical protein AURDEDRAFT_110986 [Auricularia subglabra TFB-10046 SS5]|nr:hypothetical protein AURDEDRAFT_110986 [Auricularia subglabra TFB-10046 SS5]
MAVPSAAGHPEAPAMAEPVRAFVPAHKLKRRTATAVCAGDFDEIATPRGSMTVLSGVKDVDWLRAAREEHVRMGVAWPPFALVPGGFDARQQARAQHARRGAPYDYADSYDAYSGFMHDYDDEDFDDLGYDDQDDIGPYSALPPTPGRSIASSATSRTSRPHTPFDMEGTSPTTTASPPFPSAAFAFHPGLSRRHTTSGVDILSASTSLLKRPRQRADSLTSEPDIPLAKRQKVQRRNTMHAGAQSSAGYASSTHKGAPQKHRAKSAARKGWKGWVEVEEEVEPSTLIKLDAPAVIPERRTRSGKNFDA